MRFGQNIVDGIFLERPNRYLAHILVDGQETLAHVPDPGRLPGLMIPQRKVRLIHNPGPKRKTDYTLALVRHGNIWVSVYPVFANALIEDALLKRNLPEFEGFEEFKREVKMGDSQFDFRIDFASGPLYLEVKSVSHVEECVGKFPDAPTKRGAKHVQELIALKQSGLRSAVMFVSQRPDTASVSSNDVIDPEFGILLRQARDEGVELYAYNCSVTADEISLNNRLPVVVKNA
jgi:sugar fermentation stimulation protein A